MNGVNSKGVERNTRTQYGEAAIEEMYFYQRTINCFIGEEGEKARTHGVDALHLAAAAAVTYRLINASQVLRRAVAIERW